VPASALRDIIQGARPKGGRAPAPHRRLASTRKLARCDSRMRARSASARAASAALRPTAAAAPASPPRSAYDAPGLLHKVARADESHAQHVSKLHCQGGTSGDGGCAALPTRLRTTATQGGHRVAPTSPAKAAGRAEWVCTTCERQTECTPALRARHKQ